MAEENTQTPAPKEGLGKGTLIAIVAVGVVVVLGAGYAIGKYTAGKTTEEAVTSETPPTPDEPTAVASTSVTVTTSATDETADWKTYTNSTYGFSFKYPSDFKITKENLPPLGKTENSPSDYTLTLSDSSRTLQLWINPGGFGMECGSDSYKAEIVGDKIVVKEKVSSLASDEGCPEIHGQVWLGANMSSGGNAFFINYTFNIDNRDAELKTIDKILSTFQFTK